jgi:hypothetical protein
MSTSAFSRRGAAPMRPALCCYLCYDGNGRCVPSTVIFAMMVMTVMPDAGSERCMPLRGRVFVSTVRCHLLGRRRTQDQLYVHQVPSLCSELIFLIRPYVVTANGKTD